jgi:GNAT superfamily N-acetyltransferase
MSTSLQFHRSSDEGDRQTLIREMMSLDRELYRDAGEEDLGGFEYWAERFARCPEAVSLARQRDGTLVGYYQFLPINDAFCAEVLAGRAHDGRIPLEAIVPYDHAAEPYHLYLCSMAVRLPWHGRGVASRLYREEVSFQRRLALGGRRALSLVSVVWSPCGARFFQRIGLPKLGDDVAGRAIHGRALIDGALPELPLPRLVPLPAEPVLETALAVAA